MISAAVLLRPLLTLVMVLCIGAAPYSLVLPVLLVLPLLLCVAHRLLKLYYYAYGISSLTEIVIQKGYMLLRTGSQIPDIESHSEKYLPGTY